MQPEVVILVSSLFALLLLGVPVAVCLALSSLLTIAAIGDLPGEYLVAQRLTGGIASFPLLAIPFFILAGVLMAHGGMARRLMDFASLALGGFRSGLVYVTALTSMLFGAVSGSAAAAVSSVGGFLIPEMERKGYGKELGVALTTTTATTGLLIPPSNIMIVYAVVAGNVSVAALFVAGILPGLVMGVSIAAFGSLVARRQPLAAQPRAPAGAMLRALWRALPSLMLIVIVMGGILSGVFSATEASAVSVAYALLLGMGIYREIHWRELPALMVRAVKTTAVVMLLIGSSQAMSWILSLQQVPQDVSAFLLEMSTSKLLTLLLINTLLLLVGTFLDMTPAILIFTPIFLPVVSELGVHPVHFGVVMIANLCIGLCTPPVGTCLFIGCGVGKTTLSRVVPVLLPLFVAMAAAVLLISYVPWLSLFLPASFDLVDT